MPPEAADVHEHPDAPRVAGPPALPPVTLTRTGRGWTVVSPAGKANARDLVEGLTLADLIAEAAGALVEPDRSARRSVRGPGQEPEDPAEARVAALERTVAQLEHALAARVSTERAIGVLAERNGTTPRAAFEALRREARSSGRPVAALAREVLTSLEEPGVGIEAVAVSGQIPLPGPVAAPAPRVASLTPIGDHGTPGPSPAVAAADGRS